MIPTPDPAIVDWFTLLEHLSGPLVVAFGSFLYVWAIQKGWLLTRKHGESLRLINNKMEADRDYWREKCLKILEERCPTK